MPNNSHSIRDELVGIVAFIAVIWGVFLLSRMIPSLDSYGIVPRSWEGLIGIPAAPFLHANWNHLLSNTVPLVILLILLAGSKAQSWAIVVQVVVVGGLLLWLFGRSANHIGASGLIFGLIGFLLVSGLLEARLIPLVVALFVGFLYGGSLLSGIMPQANSNISWDGHLCGAVAGGIVAYAMCRERSTDGTEAKLE